VATELVLERQLARDAFDAALRSAERARLLSVGLADELDRLRELAVDAVYMPDRTAAEDEEARQKLIERLQPAKHIDATKTRPT
jgi:hypothetical protein